MDKSSVIFGNIIDKKTLRKAAAQQKKFLKKFGDDRNTPYHLAAMDNEVLTPAFGAKVLVLSKEPLGKLPEKSVIIGNIRMGFGHYRISMAMASAAHALGYTPLWLDLNSFPETTCTKIIAYQNKLYSMASRLSQKSKLFNKLVWDPLNTEGFKRLTYNAGDQKTAELMTPVLNDLPKETPYIATHVWPSQAAVHAGFSHVVNAIPDNWAMGLHLSEGSLHLVQTPSSYLSYRTLKGFAGEKILNPMSENDILYAGHYMDDEMVSNIESDCKKRLERINGKKPLRFLLTIGGAGAQGDYFASLIKTLIPYIKENKAALYLNIGDYENVWDFFKSKISGIEKLSKTHFNDWNFTKNFAENALNDGDCTKEESHGIHVFCHKDIFAAVYATNLLIRSSDVLITKPSELAFYPVPKLMIQHVGGHECWGAIRAAEVGDGTPECPNLEWACSMLCQFIKTPDLLEKMNHAIMSNKKAGIYNGAYHAVEKAAGIEESKYEWAGR
ncbi:DUF6937 domain-containing protein [Treponema sp.]|uniref:DUF6937 domain-containing protein n=1 Tax=Treponema sp. TaxID=166 RepID=UPI00388D5C8D